MFLPGDPIEHGSSSFTVVHACRTPSGHTHIAAVDSADAIHTFLQDMDGFTITRLGSQAIDWTAPGAPVPVAGELRQGHLLPGCHPNAGPQTVLQITRRTDGRLTVYTRDGRSHLRPRVFSPDEEVSYAISTNGGRRTRTDPTVERSPATGPYANPRGALFIFVRRPLTGGRFPAGAARYDPEAEPRLHPATGENLPWVTAPPRHNDTTLTAATAPILLPETILGPTGRAVLDSLRARHADA